MAEEVELLTVLYSPYGVRVSIALQEKGIPYRVSVEDLRNKSDRLLKANPAFKKIPVLIHNGKPIFESSVILEYIEEAWPETSLLPKDPFARSVTRAWADFIIKKLLDDHIHKLFSEGKVDCEQFERSLTTLEEAASQNGKEDEPFFLGAQFTYADVAFAAALPWLVLFEKQGGLQYSSAVEKYPHLHKWGSALQAHPSVKYVHENSDCNETYLTNRFRTALAYNKKLRGE